jgi:hypothetical protein
VPAFTNRRISRREAINSALPDAYTVQPAYTGVMSFRKTEIDVFSLDQRHTLDQDLYLPV